MADSSDSDKDDKWSGVSRRPPRALKLPASPAAVQFKTMLREDKYAKNTYTAI